MTSAQAFRAREPTMCHWLVASGKLLNLCNPCLVVCRMEMNSIPLYGVSGTLSVMRLAWTPGRGWTGSTFKEKVSVEALGPRDCLFLCLLQLQLPAPLAGLLDLGEGVARGTSRTRAGLGLTSCLRLPISLSSSFPATPADSATGADTDTVPLLLFSSPRVPLHPVSSRHGRRAGPVPTAIIGGVVGSILLVLIVVGGIVVALRRRRHTFKGDYSTKKHVYGNGYSKAGIPQHHPPMAQNLQYPEDSDDDKKAGPLGGSSYEEEEDEEGGGGERKVGGPHSKYDEDAKRPYFTVDEAEARQDGYGDRTLGYQYDPEQLDLAENMVSQNDGSFISKKEWYV